MIRTPIDQFELLMHGVQAMRRYVERLACPIQGGSGVRAQFYPHQIQNVQRILTSTRIRHLIADEVGMGKTIQALAFLAREKSAGRLENPALIIAPTSVMPNWQAEARTGPSPRRDHPGDHRPRQGGGTRLGPLRIL